MTKIKEKTFFILEVDKKNKNHRVYPLKGVVEKWLEDPRFKNGEGIGIEYAVEDTDLEYEFLKESEECGVVTKLYLEDNKLFATAKFKVEHPSTEKIYNDSKYIETLSLVPKGKGAVKNQAVQDDYELYGFNLVLSSESSFLETEEKEKESANA